MDTANSTYYSLRYEHADALHRRGDCLMNRDEALRIGQTDDCKARLDNPTDCEDREFGVVVSNGDGSGWRLIRLCFNAEVRVNGDPVGYVRQLSDGDRISVEGIAQELLFNVHNDDVYSGRGIQTKPAALSRRWLALLVALPVLLFLLLLLYFNGRFNDGKQLTDDMKAEARSSVFMLRADSVWLVSITGTDTTRLASFSFLETGSGIVGTAFLTTDSLLVTARHCIEPWLNDTSALMTTDTATIRLLPVKWALAAETHNQTTDGDTRLDLVSWCSLYQTTDSTEQHVATVRSTDFNMDKSRDEIIELGDFSHEYYWRSIAPRYRRTEMMLGDVAWMPAAGVVTQPCGTLQRATAAELKKHLREGQPLHFMGHPAIGAVPHFEQRDDQVQMRPHFDTLGLPDGDIHHNGELVPGFSGGPVLMRTGRNEWRVVGIVSVVDRLEQTRKYSVPITEIDRMKGAKP
ncbi:MAG: hypothetical protein K5893_07530 [Prevotella sp.]|nr:hypothetical protein [Prevotella sp.]